MDKNKTIEDLIFQAIKDSEVNFKEALEINQASQYKIVVDKHINALITEIKKDELQTK